MDIDFSDKCTALKEWWQARPRRTKYLPHKVFSFFPIRVGPCHLVIWESCWRNINQYDDYFYEKNLHVEDWYMEDIAKYHPLNLKPKWLWGRDMFFSLVIFVIISLFVL